VIEGTRAILGSAILAAGLLFAVCANAGDRPVSGEGWGGAPAGGDFAGVRGTVTDTAGNPLAEVGVAVTAATSPVPEMLSLTAPDGSYSWPLPAGTFSLTANLDGFQAQTLEVAVPEGGTVDLNFTLER